MNPVPTGILKWLLAAILLLPVSKGYCRISNGQDQDTLVRTGLVNTTPDTASRKPADSVAAIHSLELRRLYNSTLRRADSLFNYSGQLTLAKQLYEEALRLEPDKHYPADQIVEIDKQLAQVKSPGLLSRLGTKKLLLIGLPLAVLLAGSIIFILLWRRKTRKQLDSINKTGISDTEPDKTRSVKPEQAERRRWLEDLRSEDVTVRICAEKALIGLHAAEGDPLLFLGSLSHPFSAEEQLAVYETLLGTGNSPADFAPWLWAFNESVIVFAVRMIRAFKQTGAFPAIIRLLNHKNPEVREEVILTLALYPDKEIHALFRQRYEAETPACRKLIVTSIAGSSDASDIEFLNNLRESGEFREEVASYLLEIKTNGFQPVP